MAKPRFNVWRHTCHLLFGETAKSHCKNGPYKRSEDYEAILQLKENSQKEGRKEGKEERKEEK